MRPLLRAMAFAIVASVALLLASILMYFPAVVWHRYRAPRATALMHYRAAQAEAVGSTWEPSYVWVPIERISPNLEAAVLAAEDSRFYQHHGFDLEQIRDAWERHERGGRLRGASTITQQTVKNLYLSPRRDWLRKLREAVLTGWMELCLPKGRILELYLNIVELGPGIFGAEAAAQWYFDRSVAQLTPRQAALLAATLPAPLQRNPDHPSPGLYRLQNLVLRRMERWYGHGKRRGVPPTSPSPAPNRRHSERLELPEASVGAAGDETDSSATHLEEPAPAIEEPPVDTLETPAGEMR